MAFFPPIIKLLCLIPRCITDDGEKKKEVKRFTSVKL